MEVLRIVILCFGGIFAFSFGLAWILPLAIAGKAESELTKRDSAFALLDLLLLLLDCIPVFWLFRAIPEAPSAYRAARRVWKSDPSIRLMFWMSMTSLAVTLAALRLAP